MLRSLLRGWQQAAARAPRIQRLPQAIGAGAAVVVLLAACEGAATAPVAVPVPAAAIEIVGPGGAQAPTSARVAGSVGIGAIVKGRDGAVLTDRIVSWTSSDPSVATVSAHTWGAVVQGMARGVATITATSGDAHATLSITIKAAGLVITGAGEFAIGDTARLTAMLVDAYGAPLADQAVAGGVTWYSSSPEFATVNNSGLVTAVAARGGVGPLSDGVTRIGASAEGIPGVADVRVKSFLAGLPTTARFVHAASGLGTLVFTWGKRSQVTLSAGDTQTVASTSGRFSVAATGFPRFGYSDRFVGVVPPGAQVTVYAVGDSNSADFVSFWDAHGPVASDRVLVRVVMGSRYAANYYFYRPGYSYTSLYLLNYGEPIHGAALVDEFALGGHTDYVSKTVGSFDIVLTEFDAYYNGPMPELARFHVTPQAGRATTYVIMGRDSVSMRVMTLVDP